MSANQNQLSKDKKTGVYFLDLPAFHDLMRARGISPTELKSRGIIDPKTFEKVLDGRGIQIGKITKLLDHLGITNRTGLVFAEGESRESHLHDSLRKSGIQEWNVDSALTPVITATNGLQYRVFRLTHRHQSERIGRGKRYEFLHLPDSAQEALKEQLIRHPKVCDRVGPHPQIPICYGTFPEPDAKAWWVVDRWVDGTSLSTVLANKQPLNVPLLRRIAVEVAEGLSALHEVDIIRRELTPAGILIGDTLPILLTDFELAKLLDGSPSVSKDWHENTYRAPEVCEASINAQADIYSWARIVIHCAIGSLPAVGTEADALAKCKMPSSVRKLLIACAEIRKSLRPSAIAEVLPVVRRWK